MPLDDYELRVRQLYGQQAPLLNARGERKVLYRCPDCGYAWAQEGAGRQRLRLSGEELAALAVELGASVHELPLANCAICMATKGPGDVGVDELRVPTAGHAIAGYAYMVELADPTPPVHLHVASISTAQVLRGEEPQPGPVLDFARARRWLEWLQTARPGAPGTYDVAIDDGTVALHDQPGHGAPGTEGWVWFIVLWRAWCAALGGEVAIQLAYAQSPREPFLLREAVHLMHLLASLIAQGNFAGEHTSQP